MVCDDGESFAMVPRWIKLQSHSREKRRSKDISIASWAYWIKANCAENIPSGHLPNIVVTADPVDLSAISLGENSPYPFLCEPWLASVNEEICDVVNRLVRVVVVRIPSEGGRSFFKELLQIVDETLLAHENDEAIDILWHEPGLLQGLLSVHPCPKAVFPFHGIYSPSLPRALIDLSEGS